MQSFKILEHTADIRVKVFGHNLEELFLNAVLGLDSLLLKEQSLMRRVGIMEKVMIEAMDIESLLVSFLNEVLTRSQVKKKIYNRVKFLKFSSKNLEAQIFGLLVPSFSKDIKAVSYHNVCIKQNKRGIFEVELVLDV